MFNKKQIIVIVSKHLVKAALAAVIASVIIFIISGQISKIGNSLSEKRKLSLILQKRSETTEKIRENFKIIGDNEQKIKNSLPRTDNILDFIAALESLASKNAVQQSYRFGVPTVFINQNNLNVASIDYNLNLTGNIVILINYLKDFENLPYFTGISSISVSSPPDRGWEANSSISIQAKLYARQ
ncbi:MAG: hypothetical protein AAB757_02920 [Patescibacteria group bacterium]